MSKEPSIRNWFALYTHSRCEFKVDELLKSQKVSTYLPLKKTVNEWSDRKKEIEVPLFSGYIFIYATERERLLALQQKQIVRCLTDAGRPAIVPDWQIDSLKKMIFMNKNIYVIDGIIKGDEVEIKTGAFEGTRGIVVDFEKGKHLAISIELLNRTIIAHLSEDVITIS